jgi:hypothetical protein
LNSGELVFGVARIFASFNDTFVHVTDLRFVYTLISDAKSRIDQAGVLWLMRISTVVAKPSPVSLVA